MRDIWDQGLDCGEQVWRYFTAERFGYLMRHSCAYFPAASQFADPFEGAVAVVPNPPIDPRYPPEMELGERAFRELKRLTKISCWHRAEYESDAMWKLYAGESKGVAIYSTPERMRAAFRPFRLDPQYGIEDLWGGAVRYVDLAKVRLKTNMLQRFFYKHRAFEWEKEFRLAISVRGAEEFGVRVPERGIEVWVDLATLVDGIMLGPAFNEAEQEEVIQSARAAGLEDRLIKSSLLGRPRYT